MPRRWLLLLAACGALLLVIGRVVASLYGEWTWFEVMGALPVYRMQLTFEWGMRAACAITAFVFTALHLYAVRRSIVSMVLPRRLGGLDFSEAVPGRFLTFGVVTLAAIVAVLLAGAQDAWTLAALARVGLPFGELEPFRDRDVGFYVYHLPFERSMYEWSMGAALLVSTLCVVLYAVTPSLRWERGVVHISVYVRRYLSVLAATLLLLLAWSYRLDAMDLVMSGSGPEGAFVAFDHRGATSALTGLSLGALLASAVVLWAGWHGYFRVLLSLLGVLLLAGPVERTFAPAVFAWATSDAVRRSADRPYLTTRAAFTRHAFALERIGNADSLRLSPYAMAELPSKLSPWDPSALVHDAEFARRGVTTAGAAFDATTTGVRARVLARSGDAAADWWVIGRDAAGVDARGRARPTWDDGATDGRRQLRGVRVWAGAPPYAIVLDTPSHVLAPAFVTPSQRVLHALHLRKPILAFDAPVSARTRVLFHRDITDRLARLVPFFEAGHTMQAVVTGDSLLWLVDLYAVSDAYPLSEAVPFNGASRRYVRHAALAVVQAMSGEVTFYADAQLDPIAKSWVARLPQLFRPITSLDPSIAARRQGNLDLLTLQSRVLTRTGFTNDSTPPRATSLGDDADTELVEHGPAPLVGPGTDPVLAWSVALIGADDAVRGTLVATGGPAPHTRWYARERAGQWTALMGAMQHAVDSAGLIKGLSAPRRGRVTVVPVPMGIAYTQSFYDWPADEPPRLVAVATAVVPSGDRGAAVIRTGHSLAEALGHGAVGSEQLPAALRDRAAALYAAMERAIRSGDWHAFGDAFGALGKLLRAAP